MYPPCVVRHPDVSLPDCQAEGLTEPMSEPPMKWTLVIVPTFGSTTPRNCFSGLVAVWFSFQSTNSLAALFLVLDSGVFKANLHAYIHVCM